MSQQDCQNEAGSERAYDFFLYTRKEVKRTMGDGLKHKGRNIEMDLLETTLLNALQVALFFDGNERF